VRKGGCGVSPQSDAAARRINHGLPLLVGIPTIPGDPSLLPGNQSFLNDDPLLINDNQPLINDVLLLINDDPSFPVVGKSIQNDAQSLFKDDPFLLLVDQPLLPVDPSLISVDFQKLTLIRHGSSLKNRLPSCGGRVSCREKRSGPGPWRLQKCIRILIARLPHSDSTSDQR